MASFPAINPAYGTVKNSQPKTRIVRFGDGYEQRLNFGINVNPKTYDLTFNVSETDADTIETFLDARVADNAPFTFTPPNESSSGNYVCDQWSKTMITSTRSTIVATFRQVFEP
jgi:phage-related protein